MIRKYSKYLLYVRMDEVVFDALCMYAYVPIKVTLSIYLYVYLSLSTNLLNLYLNL